MKLRSDKCHLFKFLGHVVSKAGIATDPEKLRAVDEWPRPRDIKGLRAFLGFCSYYRTFVPDFATTAAPLHARGATIHRGSITIAVHFARYTNLILTACTVKNRG